MEKCPICENGNRIGDQWKCDKGCQWEEKKETHNGNTYRLLTKVIARNIVVTS